MGDPGCPTAAIPGLSAPTEVEMQWKVLMALGSPERLFSGVGEAV